MDFDWVCCVVEQVFIFLFVGGGVCSVEDGCKLLFVGVDKVGINLVVFVDFELLIQFVEQFGSQCVVFFVDVKWWEEGGWEVVIYGGCKGIGVDVVEWVFEGVECGVGEILLMSIDSDGIKDGYDFELFEVVLGGIDVLVIVLGGVGIVDYFVEVFVVGLLVVFVVLIFYESIFIVDQVKEQLVLCFLMCCVLV